MFYLWQKHKYCTASVKDRTNVTVKCKGTTADKQCDFNYKITEVMSGIS